MKRVTLFACVAACFLATVAIADDASDIKKLYAQLSSGFKSKNVDAVLATGTADYKSKGMDGKVKSREEVKQELQMMFTVLTSVDKVAITPTKITVNGKNATVATTYVFEGKSKDEKDPKKIHTLKMTGEGKDTLVKTSTGWRFSMSHDTKQEMWMDGKKMDMSPPPPANKPKAPAKPNSKK